MKIVIITEFYPPYYKGGYELHCEIVVKDLIKSGHQCLVITSHHGIDTPGTEETVLRVMYTLLPDIGTQLCRRVAQLQNARLGRRNYHLVRRVIQEVHPDLVYVWRVGSVSIFPVNAAHDSGVPVVFHLGDYWLLELKRDFVLEINRLKKFYRSMLFGGARFEQLNFCNMITVSEALKRRYVECGFQSEHIEVIPVGISEDLILDSNGHTVVGNGAFFRMLCAGRLVEEKGVHVAIESVSHLVNTLGIDNVFLDVIGSGPESYLQRLKTLIFQNHLQDHVHLQGQVQRQELLQRYKEYDAFLFTSTWEEPFGMTILEAMAAGLPVIASKVGGASEIVADGVNGITVPPADSAKLAGAIQRLMTDETLASKLKLGGHETVREKYSHRHISDRIENYLRDKVIKGRPN